jgi:5-oxoprolinase (ATP-hydrolysing)/N-methylhydantoinase A
VELFETRTPVLVVEKRYLPDSGGPGRHRGGLGQVVRVRKLADDGRPAYAGLFPDGVLTRTAGLFGGRPGGAVRGVLLDRSGAVVKDYGVGGLVTLERPDQVLELSLAGGAGYGDPRERPLEMIQSDLDHGYVTPRGVVEDYGCEVGADGSVARPTGSSPSGERPA